MESLRYIQENYSKEEDNIPTIVLLDLNMNMMNGWEFIEEFCRFDENITKAFSIYILSSSLDESDKEQAAGTRLIKDFILKPLKADVVKKLFK
jgi:CheY-like chemotaxis protein